MPRNRDYLNELEAHIRSNPNDLLGMNSTIGANALRKVVLLIARHAKIHKDRKLLVEYSIKKLTELKQNGFIEVFNPIAREKLCELLTPIWKRTVLDPLVSSELTPKDKKNV